MPRTSENITIHTRKFFRVTLRDIDRACETPESFAIKLSLVTKTPITRAKQIVATLPHLIKHDLSAAQANRLKSLIEDIGGVVAVEPHYVTPGQETTAVQRDFRTDSSQLSAPSVCPSCEVETKEGAEYCEICLRKFRRAGQDRITLQERLPDVNPLATEVIPENDRSDTVASAIWRHRFLVVVFFILFVLFVFIVK
ncbi:MAG: hypothetical protein JSW50_13435 [Candidatus Latescibacterota bacterium]|nr:MAG: hypothetical protein JSW50_13435 [Candidatus Latescibacterota bacterium]